MTINGDTFAAPFAGLFRPLTPAERGRLRASVAGNGVKSPVLVYLSPAHGRAVLDGLNRSEVSFELDPDADVPTLSLGRMGDAQARDLAVTLNADRRHLTVEEQQAARERRVKRVAAAREQGESLRSIAAAEGVSLTQVQRDISEAAGVPGGTPERVEGSDGKSYPARTRRPARRLPPPEKARRLALQLCRLVARIMASPAAARLEEIARGHGLPTAGEPARVRHRRGAPKPPPATRWPALDALAAVLRDLAAGGAAG